MRAADDLALMPRWLVYRRNHEGLRRHREQARACGRTLSALGICAETKYWPSRRWKSSEGGEMPLNFGGCRP